MPEAMLHSRPAAQLTPQRRRPAVTAATLSTTVVVALLLVVVLLPFFLAASNAVKTSADYAINGAFAWPHSFDLSAVASFWQEVDFGRKLANSIVVSGAVAALGVLLSLLNAYAIGIGRVRGGSRFLALILVSVMVPQESLVYPIYYAAKATGLYNSLFSIVIVFSVLQSAFGTYLLASVLRTFPREIVDAAKIDGASRLQILVYVIIPVLRPTLSVLATFFFIWTWNEFLLPLVLLVSNDNQTVAVAMGVLKGQYTSDPTRIAAASLLGIAPTVAFFLIFQRTLTRGIIVGAVK